MNKNILLEMDSYNKNQEFTEELYIPTEYLNYYNMLKNDLFSKMNKIKNICVIYNRTYEEPKFLQKFEVLNQNIQDNFKDYSSYKRVNPSTVSSLIDFENFTNEFETFNDYVNVSDLKSQLKFVFSLLPKFRRDS